MVIREGSEYRIRVSFRVQHQVMLVGISGDIYVNVGRSLCSLGLKSVGILGDICVTKVGRSRWSIGVKDVGILGIILS